MMIKTINNALSQNTANEIKGKVIRRAALARRILQRGGDYVRIIDLKQDRDNPNKTVFVFRDDENFQKIFSDVLEDNNRQRELKGEKEADRLRGEVEDLKRKFAEFAKMAVTTVDEVKE